jgi:hypothetical protein
MQDDNLNDTSLPPAGTAGGDTSPGSSVSPEHSPDFSDVLKKFDNLLSDVSSPSPLATDPLPKSPSETLPVATPPAAPGVTSSVTSSVTTDATTSAVPDGAPDGADAPPVKPINKWLKKKADKWFEPAETSVAKSAPTSTAPSGVVPDVSATYAQSDAGATNSASNEQYMQPVAPVSISGAQDAQEKGFEQVYLDEGITGVGKNLIKKAKGKGFGFYLKVAFVLIIIVAGIWFLSDPNSELNKLASEGEPGYATEIPEGVYDNPAPAELMSRPTNILEQQGFSELPKDSICGLASGDIDFSAPFDKDSVKTEEIRGVMQLSSDKYGGNIKKDGVLNTCYQFSAQGAALAAANFIKMMNGSENLRTLFQNSVINTGKEFHIEDYEAEEVGEESIKVHSYKITNTFDSATTVDIGLSTVQEGEEIYAHMQIPLKWVDGDWKALAKNGAIDTRVDSIGSLKGYIEF